MKKQQEEIGNSKKEDRTAQQKGRGSSRSKEVTQRKGQYYEAKWGGSSKRERVSKKKDSVQQQNSKIY